MKSPYSKKDIPMQNGFLLDYIDVVVHIFRREQRDFYGIERLWADADYHKTLNELNLLQLFKLNIIA